MWPPATAGPCLGLCQPLAKGSHFDGSNSLPNLTSLHEGRWAIGGGRPWHVGCSCDGQDRFPVGDSSLRTDEEVAAMGGPWREHGFDPASLRLPRPPSGTRAQAVARSREDEGLGRLVLVYIAAVVMSFGLMLAILQQGW